MNHKNYFILLMFAACAVDETGYLVPPEMGHTSGQVVTNEDVKIFVYGRPGALKNSPDSLSLTNARTQTTTTATLSPNKNAFVGTVMARLNDEISIEAHGGDNHDTFVYKIADNLAAIDAPSCECIVPYQAPIADGQATLDFAPFASVMPPFVVTNVDRGIVVETSEKTPVKIAAEVGDLLCINAESAEHDEFSTAFCVTAGQTF